MTFSEATRYLNALIDYEKSPDFSYATAFKLDRVQSLMATMREPFRSFDSVHIAGTKGKGSVAIYCEALLRASGIRTGLFTSPHLVDFRERIRVNGARISESLFADITTEIQPHVARWQADHPDDRLSFFDLLTAIGFEAFRRSEIEIAVVEVGMGGRLDATNVLLPKVSVITPIALEHTRFLGPTLEAIAAEKAGIIKERVPVVVAEQKPEAAAVIARVAAGKHAPSTWVGRDITFDETGEPWAVRLKARSVDGVALKMQGVHQRHNFATALAALDEIGCVPAEAVVRKIASETIIPGRMQVLPTRPPCMLDVAHTPESAACLAEGIRQTFAGKQVTLVFSCASDKQVEGIAQVLAPVAGNVVIVPMSGPRAMSMERMYDAWSRAHTRVERAETISAAVDRLKDAGSDSAWVVCGSFVLVGAAMQLLGYSPP
ncbi:MAG TPA: folylpolyglutamate synthase/dihydrofolate synthase family protein [Candidatus Latescibacteria bacterium]|nr:folylpolyglutamate synthase/dihydrofolate synthase family protein [Candidatus Latescibacterota bacterium]HOF60739.1 folylpolyglutamate synthase/dihydrofolate synthase family protein [Candidatus Latescibacterota bacterium]HOS63559.1 folylpolyglutamate synthase/dihydrofolate synthase family protein [Candidatus Latescibacterota bacterium]HPK73309.1 folylpolyglutamate synthase/dihydrofolate synthase family protein [Candidatus Latescibacterota bacterium]